MIKNIDCSSRGPGFNAQHPNGSSHLSVLSVPRDLAGILTYACRQNTNAHKIKINKVKELVGVVERQNLEVKTLWCACYSSVQIRFGMWRWNFGVAE